MNVNTLLTAVTNEETIAAAEKYRYSMIGSRRIFVYGKKSEMFHTADDATVRSMNEQETEWLLETIRNESLRKVRRNLKSVDERAERFMQAFETELKKERGVSSNASEGNGS